MLFGHIHFSDTVFFSSNFFGEAIIFTVLLTSGFFPLFGNVNYFLVQGTVNHFYLPGNTIDLSFLTNFIWDTTLRTGEAVPCRIRRVCRVNNSSFVSSTGMRPEMKYPNRYLLLGLKNTLSSVFYYLYFCFFFL